MNLSQKILKRKIEKAKENCKKYYTYDDDSDRRCKGCKYEYITKYNNYGCRLVNAMRLLQNKVPKDWNKATINLIFDDFN